jgi:release factor glutamine methyltransferase
VALWLGHLTDAADPPVDLVVANLPYVPTSALAALAVEVRHDPAIALDGGPDGLGLVRSLLADVTRLLRPCGGVVLELGEGQADAVVDIAARRGLAVSRRIKDFAGTDRIVVLQRL